MSEHRPSEGKHVAAWVAAVAALVTALGGGGGLLGYLAQHDTQVTHRGL